MSFNCVVVGQGPQLIACAEQLLGSGHHIQSLVSDCPQVTAWSQKKGISRIGQSENATELLGAMAVDYLFSIVNHSILPPALIALPRLGAINYHDSALPAYSGFNATSWSILDGQREHGVTWHRMTQEVDAGAILVQKRFPISEDDTAFSLATKAAAAGVESFKELLTGLRNGTLVEVPPRPAENFHFKSERPGFAVFNATQPAADFVRLVRAFDFGPEENWTTRAKLRTPNGAYLCVGSAVLTTTVGTAPPGTISQVSLAGVELITPQANVLLSDFSTLQGQPLSVDSLGALGMVKGATIGSVDPEAVGQLESFDREVTKSERFWVRKLARLQPTELGELKPTASTAAATVQQVRQSLGAEFPALAPLKQHAAVCAAVACYLARTGESTARVDLGAYVADLSPEQRKLYASVVPIGVELTPQTTWAQLHDHSATALESATQRKTYARDVWTRYPALSKQADAAPKLPVALALSVVERNTLPENVLLLVSYVPADNALVIHFDTGAISPLRAERLLARLCHVVASALQAPHTPIASLTLVTPDEQKLLLTTFQDTVRPNVDFSCIHTLFEAQVARTPDKTALVFRDEELTYRELNARANTLAHHFVQLGVGPDQLVAISIERSLHMVVGLLAILKAGGAYVPLDPAYPSERLAMMLEDSHAKWLLTQSHLANQLPHHTAQMVLIDKVLADKVLDKSTSVATPATTVEAHHLAYVIFTSGSTGRPKGVMIEHRNVANFFAGMDESVGAEPGVWLAVTSISFDISVLELFWTLTRGFEVVIQEESDKASLLKAQSRTRATSRPMGFGLFYFASDSSNAASGNAYKLLLDGARFADSHDFTAVWTPERHFHAFGGLYPNAAVTSAAIAAVTQNVAIRAGSVVIPLHDPIRVAEDWAVVDNLSNGRVGLSFASGWHANDFALKPENYEHRREVMMESIDTVLRLWAGEKIKVKNGEGKDIEIAVLPRPVREKPPMWIASAGNVETFRAAGRSGHNILTNMLGQDIKVLATNFAAYREARRESGHEGDGIISVMLHTFVTNDDEKARDLARRPFGNYLTSSYDLVKVAPWMFPAFKQPSMGDAATSAFDPSRFDDADMAALLDHAFDRYFDTAGLFGSPARALKLVEQLKDAGATEVACLIDFGIDPQVVLDNLVHLDELRRLSNPAVSEVEPLAPISVREQFERRPITHLQCTPSMARMLVADGTLASMGSLKRFLLGGEALPVDLAQSLLAGLATTQVINMYGPTETTVWSTTSRVGRNGEPITIGKPIANTQIRILDAGLGLAPIGTAGELCIGGAGVVRGYLHRPDLTADRFIVDPYAANNRLYRTGDLARFKEDGAIEYIGRIDQQVKVNGYRIELGEIETILSKHASVKEAVVAVKDSPAGPVLVGYVIGGAISDGADKTTLDDWKKRWDEAYSQRTGAADASTRFNTSGWLNSYTGEPIPTDHMREWLDHTVQRILALSPKKVLEIGCGTGMILYACLPHLEHYTAVDLSPFALETIRSELNPTERNKVTLLNQAAHELDAMADKSCDLVIINSVAQYFPNVEYFTQVLEQASRVLTDGGKIFLGDVRSLEEAHAFHTMVELEKAPGQMQAALLGERIAERTAMDTELLLASTFFQGLEQRIPRLHLVSMQVKQGHHSNEMRDFRSDVVLQAGAPLAALPVATPTHYKTQQSLLDALAAQPPMLVAGPIANARLDRVHQISKRIQQAEPNATVEALRDTLKDAPSGMDPNALFELSTHYDVEVRFGQTAGTLDAVFRHRQTGPQGVWLPQAPSLQAPAFSTPRGRIEKDSLVPKLKAHLKDFLPDYMVPQAFVMMEAFPLTPNGKIDRKALPGPVESPRQTAVEFVTPGNDLERTIADIWQSMLGLERVGRKDNIFDLGASSLLTVEANNRLQTALGRKIPLVTMFRYPTIESLATHLAKTMAPSGAPGGVAASGPTVEQERQSRLDAAAQRRRNARAQTS
jgi:natural product biosynthesis luciferase-like monooxygenase protein